MRTENPTARTPDGQRDPRTVDHAGEDVATQVVGAHRDAPSEGGLQPSLHRRHAVDRRRVAEALRNPQVGGERRQDDDHDPDQRHERELVLAQPIPCVAPQRAVRRSSRLGRQARRSSAQRS